MSQFASISVSDQGKINGGDTRAIRFRPGQPGMINIRSMPEMIRVRTETGLLGMLELLRPDSARPVATASVRIGANVMALNYNATAADLAAAGDWTCQVSNSTDADMNFTTTIIYVSNFPLQQASFDIELLNIIFSEAISAVALRFQLTTSASQSDNASSLSISPTVAEALHRPDLVNYAFHLDDFVYQLSREQQADVAFAVALAPLVGAAAAKLIIDGGKLTFRAVGFDSGNNAPLIWIVPDPLSLRAHFVFDTQLARIEFVGWPLPDVLVGFLAVDVTVTFDGTIAVEAQIDATWPLPGYHIQISETVQRSFGSGVNVAAISALSSGPSAKIILEKFFIGLMRLAQVFIHDPRVEAVPHIQRYHAEGDALIADYYIELKQKVVVNV